MKALYRCSVCKKTHETPDAAEVCGKPHPPAMPRDFRQTVADALHGILCHFNHIDACGFLYEGWNKPGPSRAYWLSKADKVIAAARSLKVSDDQLLTIKRSRLSSG